MAKDNFGLWPVRPLELEVGLYSLEIPHSLCMAHWGLPPPRLAEIWKPSDRFAVEHSRVSLRILGNFEDLRALSSWCRRPGRWKEHTSSLALQPIESTGWKFAVALPDAEEHEQGDIRLQQGGVAWVLRQQPDADPQDLTAFSVKPVDEHDLNPGQVIAGLEDLK